MGTGPELFAVRLPFRNPTIRGSLATDPLQIRCIPTTRGANTTMLNRFALLGAVCIAIPVGAAPLAQADPPPPPDPAVPVNATNPLPPEGAVPSGPPGILDTPDGWHLEVVGANETQLPVAPLTTAITSREYLIAGTFTGKISGGGKTKLTGGSMEAGEQIGCGIISDETEINPGASITPGIGIPFANNDPVFGAGISLQGKVYLKPGTVTTVALDKKSFKGTSTRITITGVRVKTDQCAGQSFIRSYATLTSSTDNTDDVITYLGVTKAV
jgi:MspA